MAVRYFLLLALLAMLPSAYALDEKDAGVYLVVHNDGHVTSEALRLFKDNEKWNIQGRQPDGSWKDVLCGNERCTLQTSTMENIHGMFDDQALSKIVPGCLNSRSFALCRYTLVKDPTFVGYLFVATDRTPPVVIRLTKAASQ
jgi:hypothetical protein